MGTELKLLVASANRGKVEEYRALLNGLDCELLCLQDVGLDGDIPETGETYEENARLKAVEYAARSGLLTLADDSGLEVDALGGEPGVRSARYAGDGATDSQRVAYLLSRLQGVPAERRTARFVCVIAISTPEGEVRLCRGECPGNIATEPSGDRGFGYDPVFVLSGLRLTMAQLPPGLKNRLSHRGRAAGEARQVLRGFIDAANSR
ncbi:MAG: RdgB/HAM1 family non-canonical purine NTP pyrophosphatase [Coriobacteriia bacterium]|nr:RdgB/HAM1 family non-canonical purine NTP pyrophosphatase [Coriobacteriia bacterium]